MKFTNGKKILALFSFVTLITAFVLYKAGAFDRYINPGDPSLQTSPNGGAMNNNSTDTVPLQKKDSLPSALRNKIRDSMIIWSGSKSGRIITPDDFKTFPADTTKSLDSTERRKIDSIVKSEGSKKIPVMMPSSKSAPVFTPKKGEDNELLRIIKLYQGDSAGLRRALERYSGRKN